MRASPFLCVLVYLVCCCPLLADDASVATGLADRMTREAIAAGASGELELREDLLRQAALVAPDHAPVHWAQGEIEVDGEWKSITDVQQESRESDATKKYDALKQASTGTTAEHLQLARWCRANELDDEARYHWLHRSGGGRQ